MSEQYYTPEQLEQLEAAPARTGRGGDGQGAAGLGRPDRRDGRRAASRAPTPPTRRCSPWRTAGTALIQAFTGGDPGIAASLKRMYAEEGRRRPRAAP